MSALVTGGGGFIGSTLAHRLLDDGWAVRVVDCVTDFYDPKQKLSQLGELARRRRCEVITADLRSIDLVDLMKGVDVVFHHAGQPGVRTSWAHGFRACNELNVDVTQLLLEAARHAAVARFVFASSSSVYGNALTYPTREGDPTRPHSPYGVTKLAAELLCGAYAHNYGVPVVSLRYFTVYGPRQRPDMAIRRMIHAGLNGATFPLFGDGSHVRDFTYVADVVDANLRAAMTDVPAGTVINIAGGSSTTMNDLLRLISEVVGMEVSVERMDEQVGDVVRTGGCIERARELLGWSPAFGLRAGLEAQVTWQRLNSSDDP